MRQTLALKHIDARLAALNWLAWRDVWEEKTAAPLFARSEDSENRKDKYSNTVVYRRFAAFKSEFSVLRNEPGLSTGSALFNQTVECLRDMEPTEDLSVACAALRSFTTTGQSLKNRQHSLLSKVFAFKSPEKFVAMDRYSKAGLAKVSRFSKQTADYSEYLAEIAKLRSSQDHLLRDLIAQHFDFTGQQNRRALHDAFANRIIDHALMRIGGRFPQFKNCD